MVAPQFLTQWVCNGGNLSYPTGIAVSLDGFVYVTGFDGSCVRKFTSNGDFVLQWGAHGAGPGQFGDFLGGIAVDANGSVYVADFSNARIQKFTGDGAYLTQWGGLQPRGLAVGPDGHIYSAAGGVQVFTSDGTLVNSWSAVAYDSWQCAPVPGASGTGIAVDRSGNVYTTVAGRIQKFSSNGSLVAQWASEDTGEGLFFTTLVSGVAVDTVGNVYVADQSNNRVRILSPNDGAVLAEIAGLSYPHGLALDAGGNLYIADHGYQQVKKFGPPTDTLGLTVTTEVVGRGVVRRSRDKATYPAGSLLAFVAEECPGDRFVGWSGDVASNEDTLRFAVGPVLSLVATFERDPAAAPSAITVTDVPQDQGGSVQVEWTHSLLDDAAFPGQLCCYRIERKPAPIPAAPWVPIANVQAAMSAAYVRVLTTPADSTPVDPALFRYRVVAVAPEGSAEWPSEVKDGNSIDNLAPTPPSSVSGIIFSGTATLFWPAVSVSDFGHYAIYREAEAIPPIDDEHRVGTTTATSFVDSPGYYGNYRVTSVDVHGNESEGTQFVPLNPAGVSDRLPPRSLEVDGPTPSPASRSVSLSIGLPHSMRVDVELLDPQGRLIHRIFSGDRPAGWSNLTWEVRAGARPTRAGLYFVRVRTAFGELVRRVVLLTH